MLTKQKTNSLSLITMCLFFLTPTTAQLTKEKGHIELKNGQIVEGWILHFHFDVSPVEIKIYTPHFNSPAKRYAAKEISRLVIHGVDEFQGAIVKHYDSLKVKRIDTLLAKVLIKGETLSLYQWETRDQSYFYIRQTKNGRIIMLLEENNQYRSQLEQFASDLERPESTYALIKKAKYRAEDLHKIVWSINDENNGVTFTTQHLKSGQWRWIFGAAASITRLATEQYFIDTLYRFKGNELGISVGKEYIKGDYILRFEANIWKGNYRSSATDYTNTLKYITFTPSAQLLYSLYRNQEVQVHAGAGLAMTRVDYNIEEKIDTYRNKVSQRKSSLSYYILLNVQFRYNLELDLYYCDRTTNIEHSTIVSFSPPVGCSIKFKL